MANLETLELTIASNSESATQGIQSLIRSLSALSGAVGRSVAGLMRLNAELKTLKGYGALKLPNATTAKAKTAASAVAKGASTYDPAHNNGRGVDVSKLTFPNAKSPEQWQKEYNANVADSLARHQQRISDTANARKRIQEEAKSAAKYAEEQKKAFQQMLQAEKEAMNVRGQETKDIMEQSTKLDLLMMKQEALRMETISMAKEGKLTAKQIADRSMQYQKLSKEIEKMKESMSGAKEQAENMKNASADGFGNVHKAVSKVSASAKGLLSTIGRIFKTMLIRQAIRALLKGAKEGLDNYYQYAKKMNLSFGTAMDKVSSKWSQLKNQMGATIGQGLAAVLPILNAIASAAIVAFNALSALFALLSGGSTYSRATEVMNDYGESIKGAGGAAKQWLATFDELNVMTSGGGGGGGGGANFGNLFEETQLPQWMVEWKPIIEAVLGGVLGALILPKIFDWVKKIFGLFGDSAAKTAMDLILKLTGSGEKFNMPGLGDAATNMVTFGAGAGAAAIALPVVREEVEKIVAALDGVSLIGSLLGLLGELATKALASISVPIKLDTKQYDEFKKRHDKWIKTNSRKTIQIVYDDNIAFATRLTQWLARTEKKLINVRYDDDVAFVTRLTLWTAREDTKKVSVNIDYGINTVLKMALIDAWAKTSPTKNVYVNVQYTTATILKINAIDLWVKVSPTKQVYVNIVYTANTLLRMASIDNWAKESPTKKITMSFVDKLGATMTIASVDKWVKAFAQKDIYIVVIDYLGTKKKIDDWISKVDTKTINVEGDKYTSTDEVIKDLFGLPFWEFLRKYYGIDITANADKGSLAKLKEDFGNTASNIPATASLSQTSKNGIHNSVVAAASNITVDTKANVTATLTNAAAIKSSVRSALSGVKVKINLNTDGTNRKVGDLSVMPAKTGGLFNSADIFLANEDGSAEMIGRFGNQTGVANQREIVAGISKGVSDANAEQNALLRQQNSLLASILNKDTSVRIGASAALGRVAKQSIDMYGALVGG